MRTDSFWLASAGEKPRPKATSQATPTSVAAPSSRVALVDVPVEVGVADGAARGGRLGALGLRLDWLANVSPTRR